MAIIRKYSPKFYFALAAIALTLRNAKPVLAAETDKTTTLPEVVVTDQKNKKSYKPEAMSSPKYTVPLRDVPQTVTVIPQAVMQEQGASTLRETLRNVPGISIQAGEGGVPAGDSLSIRGFSARTDLFVDGIRDFGGYTRDSFNFEQIEVVKGPASSYAGRGSTGGSVNLVTKAPRSDAFYRGSVGFGVIDEYQRDTIDLNQPLDAVGLDNTAVRLNVLYHDADTPERDFVENERWAVAPSIKFGIDTPTRLTLAWFRMDQDNVPDYGIPWVPTSQQAGLQAYRGGAPPVDFDNFYGILARDYENTVTDVSTILLEHDFSEEVSLRNLTRYGYTLRDSVITAPRFVSTTTTNLNRQLQSRDMDDSVIANQTDLTIEFKTGQFDHTAVVGLEVAHEGSNNNLRTAPNAPVNDLFNPSPEAPFTGSVTPTGAWNEAKAESISIYGFDTMDINEQWEIGGGLRWDNFEVDYRSRATNGALTDAGRGDDSLSWRAGVVYKPRPNGSIYAAYGTSFNPSAEGLTLSAGGASANSINVDPEESETYEFGTKWDVFEEKLSVTAAVFRTDKTNARTEDPANPGDIIVLDGEQRVDGIELGVAGELTKEWSMFGAYTFLDSEVTKSANPLERGNPISNTPENSFNLWTTYQLPKNFEVGTGVQFVDTRYSSAIVGNPTNSRKEAPDYWLWDMMAAYKVNENVTLRFNIYNITDEDYIGSVGGGHFIPGAGRSAIVSTEFDF